MDRNNATFLMMAEVVTENNLFDTPGNIVIMDEIGVQGNSKPYFVITEKII
jgi:hypothetical protein